MIYESPDLFFLLYLLERERGIEKIVLLFVFFFVLTVASVALGRNSRAETFVPFLLLPRKCRVVLTNGYNSISIWVLVVIKAPRKITLHNSNIRRNKFIITDGRMI